MASAMRAWALAALVLVAGGAVLRGATATAVPDALAAAVRARMGDVEVRVSELWTDAAAVEGLVAVPDPGARTGRRVQFALRSGSRRAGTAVALVQVTAPHVRAARAFERSAVLEAEGLAAQVGEVVDVRLERLPGREELVGQLARRTVAAGEVLTTGIVAVPDAIRAGDEVRVVVRMGPIEATGAGRAVGGGRVGDVIRVGRPGSRQLQRARIVAPGTVEILR